LRDRANDFSWLEGSDPNAQDYIEIYVKCSVEECERRDPKGLYKKARAGIIKNYTGVSAPYEEPENPDLVIDTEVMEVEEAVEKVLEFLRGKGGMLEV